MAIEGFDYKEFAESLGRQAESLVPPDMDTKHKDFLIETMINFVTLSGGALSNDDTLSLNAEQAETVCQIIAEWTFHKIVDLSRSGIKFEYWDAILQKIAFAMFEICKQAILRKLSREEMLQTVEYHVVKTYKEAIKELREEEKITDEVMEQALKQSNIDTMSEKSSLKKEDKEDVFEELEHKVPDSPKISFFK